MNEAHLHLIFTHLPIVGVFVALLINCYALFAKSNDIYKLTLYAYLVLVVFVILAYITGDGASELLQKLSTVSPDSIENHEHAAHAFFASVIIVGCIASLGLFKIKTDVSLLRKYCVYTLATATLVFVIGIYTGITGGAIHHNETCCATPTIVEQVK